MSDRAAEDALWTWAVTTYDRPGVKQALLALQNGPGADVALVLWRLWLADAGRAPAGDALSQAVALSAEWRGAVVAPLRAARDALKTPTDGVDSSEAAALRRAVLDVELAAEKLQLGALARLAAEPETVTPSVEAALAEIPPFAMDPTIDLSALAAALASR